MALSNWWQVATPHKDIREGKLSEAIFAADIGDVVSGNAPIDYQDPALFFKNTYLTCGLQNLLQTVVSRLNGKKGDPVIQLQTPFGGGKTHALLTLYHAIENYDKIKHFDFLKNLNPHAHVKVVVFVGTLGDPVKGKTPWGEIASQLGKYDIVKQHDEKRRSPGKELLKQVLGNEPVLILIDELVEYVVKAKDFGDQISVFAQELTEVVKALGNSCMVCTLPSSVPYGETGERALNELQRIFGRLEAIHTPVEGVEIYEIVRKRLFEEIGTEKQRKEVAQYFFDLYQKLGPNMPTAVKELTYRDKIELAYPFHPELIDVLYEHWGSYPNFQRTRGVLRLLAEVVSDLYKKKISSSVIQSSLIDLGNQAIRREFLKHIGNEYDSVIASDIARPNAKAPKIDKEFGSEYEKYHIATAIATSVFLYSFSGAGTREVSLPAIRVAVLRDDMQHTFIADAINKLEINLWYFHSERNMYSFRTQPNINRVIVETEDILKENQIAEELKSRIKSIGGNRLEVYLWPENHSDIPDNKNYKLAVLSPEYLYDPVSIEKIVLEFFNKSGISFRIYKNTLFILALNEGHFINLKRNIKRILALKQINNNHVLLEKLTRESQNELKEKLKDAEKNIAFEILTAYRHLAIIKQQGITWYDLGIPTVGMADTLSERIRKYLQDQEKILSKVSVKYILENTFAAAEEEKVISNIYDIFLKTPGMALLENQNVLLAALSEGVKTGTIGIKVNDTIYYREPVNVTFDAIVMRAEKAMKLKEKEQHVTPETENKKPDVEEVVEEQTVPVAKEAKTQGLTRSVSLRVKVKWDKLSDIMRGVIMPLHQKAGDKIEIVMEVKANSDEGFDRTTLDAKVKETLHQTGTEIEKWDEK